MVMNTIHNILEGYFLRIQMKIFMFSQTAVIVLCENKCTYCSTAAAFDLKTINSMRPCMNSAFRLGTISPRTMTCEMSSTASMNSSVPIFSSTCQLISTHNFFVKITTHRTKEK